MHALLLTLALLLQATPSHQLNVTLRVTEHGWQRMAPEDMTFDSKTAPVKNLDHYLAGHSPQDASGHVWYGRFEPTPFGEPERSLRILWWEYRYADGSEWIAGAVLNESIEAPIGRLRGELEVQVNGHVLPVGVVTLWDQTGATFSLGAPRPFVHHAAMCWLTQAWPTGPPRLPQERWLEPQPAPDRAGGSTAWQPGWTPHRIDGFNANGQRLFPRYWQASNPIGLTIGDIEVCDWYSGQTHAHTRETFRSPLEAMWQAVTRSCEATPDMLLGACRQIWDYSAANVGSFSPNLGATHFIDGRPANLSFLDGTLPRAKERYRLTATDQAALKPFILHEGQPEITQGWWQFPECFGRDYGKSKSENVVTPLESAAGRYGGNYMRPNAWDFEHGGHESIFASAAILADPLAKRHLHLLCEEHISQGIPAHSTRSTAGWMPAGLGLGFTTFRDNPVLDGDAQRYRAHAQAIAQWVWANKYDATKYKGLLGVAWEKMDHSVDEALYTQGEATMQLAVAMHAAVLWASIEPDTAARNLWVDLAEYEALCLTQPGIVDWSRGGIIERYSVGGPAPDTGTARTIGQRVEDTAPAAYKFRSVLGAAGWCGPALAEVADLLEREQRPSAPIIAALARDIYEHQRDSGKLGSWDYWSMYMPQLVRFGWL